MRFSLGQHVADLDDAFFEYGFEFECYLRDGTRKYLDAAGNAIFVGRNGIVVNLYSKADGTSVKLLTVSEDDVVPRWPDWSVAEIEQEQRQQERQRNQRRQKIRPAWERFLSSLPAPSDSSNELRLAVTELREEIESALVWVEDSQFGDFREALIEAHESIERICRLHSEADVSGLLIHLANYQHTS